MQEFQIRVWNKWTTFINLNKQTFIDLKKKWPQLMWKWIKLLWRMDSSSDCCQLLSEMEQWNLTKDSLEYDLSF